VEIKTAPPLAGRISISIIIIIIIIQQTTEINENRWQPQVRLPTGEVEFPTTDLPAATTSSFSILRPTQPTCHPSRHFSEDS
jgi:hypothetical protein